MKLNDVLLTIIRSKIVRRVFSPIIRCLCIITKNNHVVVNVDGGICSQIHFYLIGRIFRDKGYSVKFNINWFKKNGMDLERKHARNFDLLKLSPTLPFSIIKSRILLGVYNLFLSDIYDYFDSDIDVLSWKKEKPPVCLSGYYHSTPDMFTELFPRIFKLAELKECLNKSNLLMYNEIVNTSRSVAIHVRRGDLSSYSEAYGNPCSVSYFVKAISLFDDMSTCFYIFSDDPVWCRDYLIGQLPSNHRYQIVDINDSERGYMDLILMAACSHTITSKGSLGKYSACLNNHIERMVVLNDDPIEYFWKDVFCNHKFIGN